MPVNNRQERLWRADLPFDEGVIEQELRLSVIDPVLLPGIDLVLERLEISLDAIYAD